MDSPGYRSWRLRLCSGPTGCAELLDHCAEDGDIAGSNLLEQELELGHESEQALHPTRGDRGAACAV